MEHQELLESLRSESARLAEAAAPALDRPVPSCPDWDVRQLLNHLGRVQRWVTAMVRARATDRGEFPPRPEVVDVEWFLEGATELAAALEAAEPPAPMWVMAGDDRTTRFWLRRQAVEAAIHRWDVDAAIGDPRPIETELALTGIDEALDVFLVARSGDLGGSVHFHTTDSEHGEWIVRDDPDGGLLIGHGHEKGDVALRATASDLLLWLWRREVPEDRLERFGDAQILDRWRTNLTLG